MIRNLDSAERRLRLEGLLESVEVVPEALVEKLPDGVRLPESDEPILRAALASGATHLITGDLRDFGRLLGRRVGGFRVQTPGDFLRARQAALAHSRAGHPER